MEDLEGVHSARAKLDSQPVESGVDGVEWHPHPDSESPETIGRSEYPERPLELIGQNLFEQIFLGRVVVVGVVRGMHSSYFTFALWRSDHAGPCALNHNKGIIVQP